MPRLHQSQDSLGAPRVFAFMLAAVTGIAYEAYQSVNVRGTVEVWDAVATGFGGAAGALVACLHCGGGA